MIDRRTVMTAALAAIVAAASTPRALAQAPISRITAYAFSFPALAGGDIRLADYAGHPLMVVNTASLCGFTPQYGGLQALWTEFGDRGFAVIGVPSNDFAQEPGGAVEIADTAQHHMGLPFRSRQKPSSRARMRIRSTGGQPKRGRTTFRAGTFTST